MSYFSVIIPCYNCKSTIDRLLNSLDRQNEDIEVILCDDSDNEDLYNYFPTLCKKYKKIELRYIKREGDYKYHSPGNTKHYAMPCATGKWLTFSDHDDYWEDEAFINIRRAILENNEKRFVESYFREWDDDTKTSILDHTDRAVTWMHGKFYNLKWLRHNNINFKPDLYTHEDLYFNSLVMAELFCQEHVHTILQGFTYRWVYNKNSLSRSYYNTDHFFIESHFDDYIHASGYTIMDIYKKYPNKRRYCLDQCLSCIIYAYLYYQSFDFRLGDKKLPNNISYLSNFIHDVIDLFKIEKKDIIDYCYKDPNSYFIMKEECMRGAGQFIETKSFCDFINTI